MYGEHKSEQLRTVRELGTARPTRCETGLARAEKRWRVAGRPSSTCSGDSSGHLRLILVKAKGVPASRATGVSQRRAEETGHGRGAQARARRRSSRLVDCHLAAGDDWLGSGSSTKTVYFHNVP